MENNLIPLNKWWNLSRFIKVELDFKFIFNKTFHFPSQIDCWDIEAFFQESILGGNNIDVQNRVVDETKVKTCQHSCIEF